MGLLIQKFDTSKIRAVYETLLASVIVIFVLGFQFFNRTMKYMALSHRDLKDSDQAHALAQHPLQLRRFSALYVLCIMAMAFSMVRCVLYPS